MSFQEQGAALLGGGRFHEALQQFGQLLRSEPASLAARIGLARACVGTGDAWSAVAWLSDACRIAPADAAPAGLLAELLLELKQYAQALPVYQRLYSSLGRRDRTVLLHLAFCLEQTGAIDEAIVRYREAIALDADFMEAHVDIAGVLWRTGDFEGTLRHAQKAAALAPGHPYAVRILGTALLQNNRLEEAEVLLRRALALKPDLALSQLDLAFALLGAGRLREGWEWYAMRWNDTERLARPVFYNAALEWQGPRAQPPAGRTIALYAEQGFGDVIQFIRYARLLQADGARLVGVVQPELVPLVDGVGGIVCLTADRNLHADWHAALLDLPMHYGTTLESIPAQVPYLHAPQAKVAQWKERMRPWQDKFRIGLCWAGFAGQVNNRNRSVALSELRPLMAMAGVQCFSLQKGDGGTFTNITIEATPLVDLTAHWADFSDSAAMMGELDLVITVDTALAHLAGALARPVWVLLGPNADWRWLRERGDSPWYPTMRLFRRAADEPRSQLVGRVAAALESHLAGRVR